MMDSGLGVKTVPDWESEQVPERVESSYVQMLWDKRRFLALLMAKTAAVAIVVSFLLPVRYKSTARFLPSQNNQTSLLMGMAGKAMAGGGLSDLADAGGLFSSKTPGALYLQIIDSRSMQDRIINQFDLRRVYRHRSYKDTRKDLAKYTHAEEDRKSGVISISVVDKDRARAAAIVDAYLRNISLLSNDLDTSAAHNERVFVQQRLATAESELDSASKALSDFSTKNAAIDITLQGKSMIEEAAALQGQVIAAQSELQGLQAIYTANNVRVRTAQARIAELRRQLDNIGGWKDSSDKQPEDREAPDIYPSIRSLPALGLRYAELYRRVKTDEVVYTLLTQQYEMAKIEEAREVPTIKVLDSPDIPEKKDSPTRSLIVILSVLMAGAAGCSWLIGRRKWGEIPNGHPSKRLVLYFWSTTTEDIRNLRLRLGRRSPRSDS